jgi:DNA-binding beta-propeller fold protein YncE
MGSSEDGWRSRRRAHGLAFAVALTFGASAALGTGTALAASGDRLWVARYNGPANGDEEARAAAVSPDGATVFVTGPSAGSTGGSDYATSAYDAATGHKLWVSRYNGPGNGNDEANSIAVSPDGGTVFVTGESLGSTSFQDYATVAYDATTGGKLWSARYNGPVNSTDLGKSVAVSPDGGTVFVTGKSTGRNDLYNYATVSYDAVTGRRKWEARYNGRRSSDNGANSVVVSPDGSRVFVTGYGAPGPDYATVAYDAATGHGLWVSRYGSVDYWNEAFSIAASPDGSRVFVTGYSTGLTSGFDYATVSYDAASGTQLWAARFNGPGNDFDAGASVALTPNGSVVFVTGVSAGTTTANDYVTIAYDAATGHKLWGARFNGPGNGNDGASSLAVSPDGAKVFVTGGSVGPTTSDDYTTLAYDAATGHKLWGARYDGPGGGNDRAASVAVSPDGGVVFVTGFSTGSTTGEDFATVAYQG